jgi:hypothetical protein
MASKKNITRRGLDNVWKDKILSKLVLRAKVEVKRALKRNEAGTITNVELDRKLKQVAANLKRVVDYTGSTLDEVSQLLQRNQARTITKGQMNIGLRRVARRLWFLANFSNNLWPKKR